MELLVTLCTETKLGRNAVSDAELCKACIDFASDLLRCLTTKIGDDAIATESSVDQPLSLIVFSSTVSLLNGHHQHQPVTKNHGHHSEGLVLYCLSFKVCCVGSSDGEVSLLV